MNDPHPVSCPTCGAELAAGGDFCPRCGAPLAARPSLESRPPAATSLSSSPNADGGPLSGGAATPERLTWEAAVPLTRSTLVLQQLALVILVSCALVACFVLVLAAIEGDLTWELAWQIGRIFILILVGFAVVAVLIMLLLYGNRYEYRFTLDEQGITATTTGGTRKKNTVVNLLLLLSGRPSAAGAGMLAQSRQGERARWKDVDNLTTAAGRYEITLRRRRRVVMLVQCTAENYETVLHRIQQAIGSATDHSCAPTRP